MKNQVFVVLAVIIILTAFYANVGNASPQASLTLQSSGVVQQTSTPTPTPTGTYSYIISVSGSNYQMTDGTTDQIVFQSTSSSQVFSNAVGNCSTGSSIDVEAGTYSVTTTWTIINVNGVTVNFESGAKLIAGNELNSPVLLLEGVNNCNIVGITIDGNAANQALNGYWANFPDGIFMGGVNDTINHATVFDCRRIGIEIGNFGTTNNCGVINSKIYDCGWNGPSDGVTADLNDFFINNEVYGCSDVGITTYATATLITGNYVHDMNRTTGDRNSEWGIASEGGSNSVITNNTVYNCVIGIQDTCCNNVTISNNVVSCSAGYDVKYGFSGSAGQTYGIAGSGSYCTITNNTVSGMLYNTTTYNGGMGINWYGNFGTISGNIVSNCGSCGICLDASGTNNNTVNLNTISGTGTGRDWSMSYGGCGIELVAGCDSNYISQNQVFSNSNYGIALDPTAQNNILKGNNLYSNINGQIYDPNVPENTLIS